MQSSWGDTIYESNVILNRGYDYAYTFNPMAYPRPWGQVPDLVNVNGVWAIPENEASLPEGIQPTTRIILKTNNKNLSTDERIVDVVHLPGNVNSSELPPEVRKYLINVDGSDAGAYNGTITAGWVSDENGKNTENLTEPLLQMAGLKWTKKLTTSNTNGIMLADTITPDGVYVNAKGEKTNYIPGWTQDEKGWAISRKMDTMPGRPGFRVKMENGIISISEPIWRPTMLLPTVIMSMPMEFGMDRLLPLIIP